MQKSENSAKPVSVHRKTMASTTLNRRYVKRPTKTSDIAVKVRHTSKVPSATSVRMSPQISHFANDKQMTSKAPAVKMSKQVDDRMEPAKMHPMQERANIRMKERNMAMTQSSPKLSAKELKDRAIQKALATAAAPASQEEMKNEKKAKAKSSGKMHFGMGRVFLALSCAAAAVFAIAYFVNMNMPDISLKVAAMQTGIDAAYPNYIPRDFRISSITSENGKITLEFVNDNTKDAFSLIEEKSSWDSNALLNNFVKDAYGDKYDTVREQGLTLYINESNAAWVNGGVVYKLETTSGSLTNKQIRSIAVSL